MTEFVRHLVALNETRNGKPRTEIELTRLCQWILSECQLRWPDTEIETVTDAVSSVEGYRLEDLK